MIQDQVNDPLNQLRESSEDDVVRKWQGAGEAMLDETEANEDEVRCRQGSIIWIICGLSFAVVKRRRGV